MSEVQIVRLLAALALGGERRRTMKFSDEELIGLADVDFRWVRDKRTGETTLSLYRIPAKRT